MNPIRQSLLAQVGLASGADQTPLFSVLQFTLATFIFTLSSGLAYVKSLRAICNRTELDNGMNGNGNGSRSYTATVLCRNDLSGTSRNISTDH